MASPVGLKGKILAALCALPLMLPGRAPEQAADLRTRVTVLDVGQGTSVIIQSGGQALLYDTGGGDPAGANMATSVILPYLRRQGVSRLETFIVSHPDTDHSAGTGSILQNLAVHRFRFGAPLPGINAGRHCLAGQAWRWPGGQRFRFLSPTREQGLSSNNRSCVLQVEIGPYRLLLPGDIGATRERELVRYWGRQLRSDWLLLAHHGSKTSTSHALLKTVQPQTVVINSGYGNRFGHPHPVVLERVRERNLRVFDTASGGALEFEFAPGREPVVSVFRQKNRRFWM